jgi:hypothetical protein
MSQHTTLKQARLKLNPLRVTVNRTAYGDYRVALATIANPIEREASAYYTDSLDDAIDTGCAMATHLANNRPN